MIGANFVLISPFLIIGGGAVFILGDIMFNTDKNNTRYLIMGSIGGILLLIGFGILFIWMTESAQEIQDFFSTLNASINASVTK